MKDLKKRIIGIMIIIVCSLLPLGIALGSEVILPVPVSDNSIEVKKFTEKDKGKKYYFYYVEAKINPMEAYLFSGVIEADKDETPRQSFEKLRKETQQFYKQSVITVLEFIRLE